MAYFALCAWLRVVYLRPFFNRGYPGLFLKYTPPIAMPFRLRPCHEPRRCCCGRTTECRLLPPLPYSESKSQQQGRKHLFSHVSGGLFVLSIYTASKGHEIDTASLSPAV